MVATFLAVMFLGAVDADTIKVNLPCQEPIFCDNVRVRVARVNAPERNSNDSRYRLGRELVTAVLSKAKIINLENCTRGKYFRIVCEVTYDGQDLGQMLLWSGLVDPYKVKSEATQKNKSDKADKK